MVIGEKVCYLDSVFKHNTILSAAVRDDMLPQDDTNTPSDFKSGGVSHRIEAYHVLTDKFTTHLTDAYGTSYQIETYPSITSIYHIISNQVHLHELHCTDNFTMKNDKSSVFLERLNGI